jgi:hypothetical protein
MICNGIIQHNLSRDATQCQYTNNAVVIMIAEAACFVEYMYMYVK